MKDNSYSHVGKTEYFHSYYWTWVGQWETSNAGDYFVEDTNDEVDVWDQT